MIRYERFMQILARYPHLRNQGLDLHSHGQRDGIVLGAVLGARVEPSRDFEAWRSGGSNGVCEAGEGMGLGVRQVRARQGGFQAFLVSLASK